MAGELAGKNFTQDNVMALATGLDATGVDLREGEGLPRREEA
jgi:hypothetical protein